MANRLESHVIKRALPDATTFRENRTPEGYNNAIAFMNRWVEMHEIKRRKNQPESESQEREKQAAPSELGQVGNQLPEGLLRLRIAENVLINVGASSRILKPVALYAIGALDKVALRTYPVERGREVIEGLEEQYQDLLRERAEKKDTTESDTVSIPFYAPVGGKPSPTEQPFISAQTRAQRKKAQAQTQQNKSNPGRSYGRSAKNSEPEVHQSPKPLSLRAPQPIFSSVTEVTFTPESEREVTSSEVNTTQGKDIKVKNEVGAVYKAGLHGLIAEQRNKMAGLNPDAVVNGDPQKTIDTYAASLTHSYLMNRLGVSLSTFPHTEAVLAVLQKIFHTDTTYLLNFAEAAEEEMYLSPENTDRLYKEVLFPDKEWKKKPYGFKEIAGVVPADIVRIVFTPEGGAKIAEGIQVVPHFHAADELKARRDRNDFESLLRRFSSIFTPDATFSVLAEPRKSQRNGEQPHVLEEGKEVVLPQPNTGIQIDVLRRLSEDVFKTVLPDAKYPLHLAWRDARRANAYITDSSHLDTFVRGRRRGGRF
jgi:hypothetical protein